MARRKGQNIPDWRRLLAGPALDQRWPPRQHRPTRKRCRWAQTALLLRSSSRHYIGSSARCQFFASCYCLTTRHRATYLPKGSHGCTQSVRPQGRTLLKHGVKGVRDFRNVQVPRRRHCHVLREGAGTYMVIRMEPVWWQNMQSKLPITLGRAFFCTFFAVLRLPILLT